MKTSLKYKNKKLRTSLKKTKLFTLFNKTLTARLKNNNTQCKFKTLNLLRNIETPKNICVLTNKSRNINRLLKTSGTATKELITHRQFSGFKKSSW